MQRACTQITPGLVIKIRETWKKESKSNLADALSNTLLIFRISELVELMMIIYILVTGFQTMGRRQQSIIKLFLQKI